MIEIRDDKVSGSTKIAIDTCEFIKISISSGVPEEEIESMLMEILRAHRPMAVLHNCIRHFLRGGNPDDFLDGMRKRMERASRLASEYIEKAEIGSIMTLSSSSAVEMALSNFRGKIFVMESRPMLEGISMAERLQRKGRDVTAVTDAFGISMVARGEVDAVVIGADGLYRDMLINKVGSYALYAAAEHSGIDFVVVLTSDKIFPDDVELSEEEMMQFHEPREITDRVRAMNPYFEVVPIRKGMIIIGEKEEIKGGTRDEDPNGIYMK